MLNRDYKEMLQCLAAEGTEFLIVGAYALAAHGIPRSTADFDIWVNPTPENSMKVYRALAIFGAPLDIITKISGNISFPEARSQAEIIQLDDVQMPILSRDHLVTNKLATGRPKDIEDVKLLKQHRGES